MGVRLMSGWVDWRHGLARTIGIATMPGMARPENLEIYLREHGAQFGEWLGTEVVTSFGSAASEVASLRDGKVGLVDRCTRGTVVATGTEVVPLLQGIVTSDVFQLAEPGSGQLSCAVNSKGRLICDVRLMHGPEEMLIMDFEAGLVEGGVVSHFRANVMSEDARFTDRSAQTSVLGLIGDAAPLLQDATLSRPLSSLGLYDGAWGEFSGMDVVIRRMPFGWDVLCDTADVHTMWVYFVSSGALPVGEDAAEVLRVASGVPRWGAELDERVIPLEAGLNDTIAYDKGCYVGQEIIARLDTLGTPARLLRRLALDGQAARGDDVFDGDKKVGEVRTIVPAPDGLASALGYVKRNHNDIGHVVAVGSERVRAQIGSLEAS